MFFNALKEEWYAAPSFYAVKSRLLSLYIPWPNVFYNTPQWAKTREKIHFFRKIICLSKRLKNNIFWKNSNVHSSLDGSCMITYLKNWNNFSKFFVCLWCSESTLELEKFPKMLILAFDPAKIDVPPRSTSSLCTTVHTLLQSRKCYELAQLTQHVELRQLNIKIYFST